MCMCFGSGWDPYHRCLTIDAISADDAAVDRFNTLATAESIKVRKRVEV